MNPQTIKTDILLALTFLTGVLGDFGVTLTQTRSDEIASITTAIVTGLITVIPVILATFREVKHLQAAPTKAPAAPAPDPAATQPASAI